MSPQPTTGELGRAGSVVVTLKDGLGNPIAVKSARVVSAAGAEAGKARRAAGRPGEVAALLLQRAPGEYVRIAPRTVPVRLEGTRCGS